LGWFFFTIQFTPTHTAQDIDTHSTQDKMATIAVALLSAVAAGSLPGQHPVGQADSYVELIQALVDEKLDRFDELLNSGTEDPNGLDVITPLYAAQEYVRSSKRRHAILRQLLRAGAHVDGLTQDGSTTLMLAAYHGDVRSAQVLLNHGADPLRKNNQGYNAFDAAKHGRHSELAEMMTEFIGESGRRMMASEGEGKVEL
jgi:ankyrin repeat protein